MPKKSAVFAVLSVGAFLTVTGCAASAPVPAADEEGMATFSCGLAAGLAGGTLATTREPADEDTKMIPLPYAAASLSGGSSGAPLAGYEDLFEPGIDVVMAVMMGDAADVEDRVQGLLAACEENGLDFSGVEVSLEERTDYACTLAEHINSSEEAPEEWMRPGLDDSYLFAAAHSVTGLLLEPEAFHRERSGEDFSDATDLMSALSRVDIETAVSSIESIAERCD